MRMVVSELLSMNFRFQEMGEKGGVDMSRITEYKSERG